MPGIGWLELLLVELSEAQLWKRNFFSSLR